MKAVKASNKSSFEQMKVVAEFHAHRIKPERIAYRTGIALPFIQQLLAGEYQPVRFNKMMDYYKKKRRMQRLRDARSLRKGVTRLSQELKVEQDF